MDGHGRRDARRPLCSNRIRLMHACPSCSSDRIRRGGMAIWLTYVALILFAMLAVLVFQLNAAIVAGVMIAVVVLAHLIFNQRVCLDCGEQWSRRGKGPAG